MSGHPTVWIRTHVQRGGEHVASTTLPDGRVIRVVGCLRYDGSRIGGKDVVDVLKNWVTWVRRGSLS